MDYSIFIYLILTVLVVALGWFVNLPAVRSERTGYGFARDRRAGGAGHSVNCRKGEGDDCGLRRGSAGVTRRQMLNRILICAVFLLLFAVSACRIAVRFGRAHV